MTRWRARVVPARDLVRAGVGNQISARVSKALLNTYLCSGNAVEADAHQNTGDGDLVVTEFDAIKVLNTERICGDQCV